MSSCGYLLSAVPRGKPWNGCEFANRYEQAAVSTVEFTRFATPREVLVVRLPFCAYWPLLPHEDCDFAMRTFPVNVVIDCSLRTCTAWPAVVKSVGVKVAREIASFEPANEGLYVCNQCDQSTREVPQL